MFFDNNRLRYLASVQLAFLVSCAYHVAGDLFGRVSHFLAVLVGYDRHVDFLQYVGRLLALAQSAPTDHGAFDAFVGHVGCARRGKDEGVRRGEKKIKTRLLQKPP